MVVTQVRPRLGFSSVSMASSYKKVMCRSNSRYRIENAERAALGGQHCQMIVLRGFCRADFAKCLNVIVLLGCFSTTYEKGKLSSVCLLKPVSSDFNCRCFTFERILQHGVFLVSIFQRVI